MCRIIMKLWHTFAEYRLFYRSLLQKRPIILSILLTEATPYNTSMSWAYDTYRLFYRSLLQKRRIILRILLTEATLYDTSMSWSYDTHTHTHTHSDLRSWSYDTHPCAHVCPNTIVITVSCMSHIYEWVMVSYVTYMNESWSLICLIHKWVMVSLYIYLRFVSYTNESWSLMSHIWISHLFVPILLQ